MNCVSRANGFVDMLGFSHPRPSRLKHGIGADLFFHVISMLQKNCVIKDHFIIVMQKGIVRSCLPENFTQLALLVLEILSIMCSQNGHL